eukprot:3668047-Rhodomonas_salina.1
MAAPDVIVDHAARAASCFGTLLGLGGAGVGVGSGQQRAGRGWISAASSVIQSGVVPRLLRVASSMLLPQCSALTPLCAPIRGWRGAAVIGDMLAWIREASYS